MTLVQKGEMYTVTTKFDTYFIELDYCRRNMSYTVKVYNLPPEVQIDLPIPFRFLKLPVDWMIQKLVDEPLIQRVYYLSQVRDPETAIKYTLFAYEFPYLMEEKLKEMDKRIQIEYEDMALEYFKRNRPKPETSQKKVEQIDWSKVKVYDWQDDE